MQDIKKMVETYSHAELEKCVEAQVSTGTNACFTGSTTEETMSVLSKASYVKQLLEEGKVDSVIDGIRKLAGSIRQLQQNEPTASDSAGE